MSTRWTEEGRGPTSRTHPALQTLRLQPLDGNYKKRHQRDVRPTAKAPLQYQQRQMAVVLGDQVPVLLLLSMSGRHNVPGTAVPRAAWGPEDLWNVCIKRSIKYH